jgi:tRNA(Arg) A34 adenosine deaminase TadA
MSKAWRARSRWEARVSEARDTPFMRRAIALATAAAAQGARPFGALVVAADGTVVAEAGSVPPHDVRDWTAHSEMMALRAASARLSWDELGGCTLYASTEPCPMCASAAYWCNIPRLVYGVGEPAVRGLRAGHVRAAGLPIGARTILGASPRPIEVVGPFLEAEAIVPHRRFWADAPDGV